MFTTFTSRLAADALAFERPADLDALDACAQQLAQVRFWQSCARGFGGGDYTCLLQHPNAAVASILPDQQPA